MPRPDCIAYRYGDDMVYVPPADNYENGIALAKESFPQLAPIAADRLTICVNGLVGGKRRHIRIGPTAWSAVMGNLARYEVLDVVVQPPEITVKSPDGSDELPNYEDVKEKYGSEPFLNPSRGPSPLHKPISLPESGRRPLTKSRSSSPSCSPSNSSPSTVTEWAKGLFKQRN